MVTVQPVRWAHAGRYHPTEPVVIDVGAALHGNVMFKISSLSLGDPDTGAAAQRNRLRQSRLRIATGRNSCGAPHRAALRRHHQLFVRGDFAADQPAGCTGGTGLPPLEYAEYRLNTRPRVRLSTAS